MDGPDLAGFRAARERKRVAFSEAVILLGPGVVVYPDGTSLDPESGQPYDPTIEPVASGASALVHAEWVWRSSQDPADEGAAGTFSKEHPMLIAASAAASATTGMTHFEGRGERYQIESVHFDGVTGIDRCLIYGERT